MLPCENHYLRAQASQRQTYTVQETQNLPSQVENSLAKLILHELSLAGQLEVMKQEMAQ